VAAAAVERYIGARTGEGVDQDTFTSEPAQSTVSEGATIEQTTPVSIANALPVIREMIVASVSMAGAMLGVIKPSCTVAKTG
jgi:hypothetical protein